ncbi:hypothetical protein O3P69_000462 [Scylla paramamosain]|uniref:Uncharacterized protein n=1 Tax=Scylla paramamosain TaxID=85552 RepID=A0AAW0UTL6_SCYPA
MVVEARFSRLGSWDSRLPPLAELLFPRQRLEKVGLCWCALRWLAECRYGSSFRYTYVTDDNSRWNKGQLRYQQHAVWKLKSPATQQSDLHMLECLQTVSKSSAQQVLQHNLM